MSDYAISLKRTSTLLAALTFTALLLVVNFAAFFSTAGAAQLTSRSLTLSSTLSGTETGDSVAGSPTNGSDAEHRFRFTSASGFSSVTFQYCTTALGTCNAPSGLSLAGVSVEAGGGSASAASNTLTWVITEAAGGAKDVTFGGITNPTYEASPANPDTNTFFVRIVTHNNATPDPGNTDVDEGTVASAITQGIEITARVAETLGFSTTGTFASVTDPTTACNALTGSGAITLGNPAQENTLELGTAYDNYSAFRIYTNSANGVAVQYHGDTLTHSNGVSDIDEIGGTAVVSAPGSEQFGLAIDTTAGGVNNVPANSVVGGTLDMTHVTNAAGLAADGPLTPATEYANGDGLINTTPDALFAFEPNTPTTIASTDALQGGYTECKTVAVRYLANISPTTTSGTYTTTIVYSAVPTY